MSGLVPALALALALVATAALVLGAVARGRQRTAKLRRGLERTSEELEHLQQSFGRFAPQEVVERVIATGVSRSGEKKDVTVLFADLIGFTALGESLDPDVLVRLLNGYFRTMSQAVTDHRGHVSKFIGDGMLVLFGALEPNPWQANDAAHAALAMQERLVEYNAELAAQGLGPLRVGVGIHRGPVVAGVIGSNELMEFTVIGSTVNLAARVEHLTRELGVDILVTSATADKLDPRFRLRELPATPVRGVADPVVTLSLEGFDPQR